jgi:hypothetical protein
MALDDQQIVDLVNAEFEDSIGIPGGDISQERALAYNYYLRKLYGDEEKGQSKVVTSDVSDIVDGTMTSLMRMFTTADNLVEFDPVGLEDEAGAKQESAYITHIFFNRNPAFEIMFFWMFDALVQKNGYVKCYWDETERTTIESYEGLTEQELLELLDDEELEAVEQEERRGEFADPDTGEMMEGIVYDVRFNKTKKGGRIRVDNVPPEEIRVSKGTRSLDLNRAKMVGHERDDLTRGDLLAMGFDKEKVMELPASEQSLDSSVKTARRDKSDDQGSGGSSADKTMELVGPLREVYQKIDVNEDGKPQLKQVFMVDGKLLEMNDIDRQPFHAICPHPLPHKHVGQASAEKVMDNQRISSTLMRQILMNLHHVNNPGKTVWEQAMGEHTMPDLLTRRIGRVVRVRRPAQEAISEDTVPFTAGESFPMLEYLDRKKAERSGVAPDIEGLSADELKNIQISVMAEANDTRRMKLELIARTFAETGFKSLFLHMHELALKHQRDTDVVKLLGSWTEVKPAQWRERTDMTAVIGLGIANRDRNLIHLNAIWEKQVQMAEGGGLNLTVTPQNLYATTREIVKNANIGKPPEMFFTDPGDQKAPPPGKEQMELQKQQVQLEQEKEANRKQKAENDMRKLQLDGQEMQLQHAREVAKLEEQREARLDKAFLDNEMLQNELQKMGFDLTQAQSDQVIKRITALAQAEQARASARQADALAVKAEADAEATRVETQAAKSGITELVEDLGESDGTE